MRHKKIGSKVKKTVLLGALAALTATSIGYRAGATSDTSGKTDTGGSTDTAGDAKAGGSNGASGEYSSDRINTVYSVISSSYSLSDYTGNALEYPAGDSVSEESKSKLSDDTQGYTKGSKVLKVSAGDKVQFEIDVPQDGLYFAKLDYLSYDESILPVKASMSVDGEYPFYESRNLEFDTTWKLNDEPSLDRYDNETVTVPEKVIQWEEKYIQDSSYRHSEPLKLELKKGKHVFEMQIKEGNALLGGITLEAPSKDAAYSGSEKAEGNGIVEIEGEKYSFTNDSAIHAIAEYDTSLSPYEVKDTVLNTIDSDSFNSAGQKITYTFDAPETGNYYIALNYRQSEKTDFPVFVDIEVDGKVPNEAFRSYGMAYSTKYKTSTLEDSEGNKLSINLEKGSHSISFTISMAPICYIMEEIDVIMSEVNDLALEITKVAGNNADKYRDLKLTRYIPGIEDTLYCYYDRLVELEKSAVKWSDSDKGVAVMSSLLIAAEQLKSLADNPDEIPYRIAELTTSQSSVTHFLATAVDNLITNDLAIDRLWIYQEGAELPKKPGIFKSAWMNIQRFVASFTEQAYSTKNTNKDHIQVWVNRSNQYVQIMQKMIDEYFTPETGIEVDISIMPDQYKLVLSNSSGSTPDVATGINYTVPYELAIRGALVNMMDFDDFKEAAADYEPGFFMTGTVDNGIYSMPETMNFWVMFYRSDIMEKLGIEVPQTIDEVIDILPDLQMRGLNFYYPTAGMILMRNFHGTTPLIVQQGGSLYYPTASEGTALGGEATVNGFTKLTDLFTIYNLPVNIDNFYQHFRNGDMPLGIADYATYNMLTNAAPELASSWDIALAPGTTQEDGTIDRSVCGCAEASVIFKSDDERQKKAWEFVKWWSSAETQATFGQTIQISYGSEYIWPTANMKAFQQLPLETNAKNVIAETAKNVVDVPRVPGTYLLEREMSNTFNDIAVNAQDARTRIDKAVKSINHEFDRKLEEFGYNDSNGSVIKDYKIPTLETVTRLLGR